jgi:hypothetical protein
MLHRIICDSRTSAHILNRGSQHILSCCRVQHSNPYLVAGVRAAADKTDLYTVYLCKKMPWGRGRFHAESHLELLGPIVLLRGLGKLGDGGSEIGGEGTVDMGLELGEVDLDKLVVLGTLVLAELLCI